MKIVEQVDIDGNIISGYDTSLSPSALFNSISRVFPAIYKDEDGLICGEYKGRKYAIRAKNITYLGHPHPLYKKRIQISDDLQSFYKEALQKGCVPILLGVYTCGDNTVFCDFNIEDYIEKKAHNSSAHVYTNDLANATIDGYFYKEDYFGNKITVFKAETVDAVLEEKLGTHFSKEGYEYTPTTAYDSLSVGEQRLQYDPDFEIARIEKIVMEYFAKSERHWDGIECYKEMIGADYRNKFQPEWPGFFLEYSFENYLKTNGLTDVIKYAQDKSKGGIDLDLYFPRIDMYGDLKAHSRNSKAVQGNDWDTIHNLINNPIRDNHIYYIVAEHDTYKDSEYGYAVTFYWNKIQGKRDLMSYHKRMKNSIDLTHAYIFDINANNQKYLSKFRQGINSNGKLREPKIMIDQENFSHFLLTEKTL